MPFGFGGSSSTRLSTAKARARKTALIDKARAHREAADRLLEQASEHERVAAEMEAEAAMIDAAT